MLEVIFWICSVLVLHTYFLYPLIVLIWHAIGRKSAVPPVDHTPSVSIVLAVYNEEAIILEKIENLKNLDYPADRLEILIGSDGSSDNTNTLLGKHCGAGCKIFRFGPRRGKPSVINDIVAEARGDIVVLTDANTRFFPDTIRELASPFADPAVGAVSGELNLYTNEDSVGGRGEVTYWRYENWLKEKESEIFSTIGAAGAVYAVRRVLFVPLPTAKSVVDDLLVPLRVVKAGYRTIYRKEARAEERVTGRVGGEFQRKIRISASNFNTISDIAPLLHPRYHFVSFALWSHKIIRWCAPFLLLTMVCASGILAWKSAFFLGLVYGEIVFLILVLMGVFAEKFRIRIGILSFPYYFIAMNAALLLGFFRFLRQGQPPTWTVVR
ncbi:MAG TPA: glycosyltransferase family 2 protein [Bacteroidota bacterium]|nr:glycosyltransferase family 2 protein [Bacteroidota bacterium]